MFSSKATLAYINTGELERAKEQLQMCPPEEATTQYLSFLVAINLGREIAGEFWTCSGNSPQPSLLSSRSSTALTWTESSCC